jgi:hypothetical protein
MQWDRQLYHQLGLQNRKAPEDAKGFFKFIHPEDRAVSKHFKPYSVFDPPIRSPLHLYGSCYGLR